MSFYPTHHLALPRAVQLSPLAQPPCPVPGLDVHTQEQKPLGQRVSDLQGKKVGVPTTSAVTTAPWNSHLTSASVS